MDLALPPRLEQFVHAQVRAGRYADPADVVRDAVRRMQEQEAPETPPGLLREALAIAHQAQRDVLGLVQRADSEADVFQQLLGTTGRAVDSSLDVARRIPVAREIEKALRGSLDQVTKNAERGEREAKNIRTGLESTARALGVLASVLEKVNATTSAISRPPATG